VRALLTLGFAVPPYLRADPGAIPPSAGWWTSAGFDPPSWKPNYPNPAFANMRADDAFWGARLVMRFSDDALRTIVREVGYDDPRGADHVSRVLIERRDAVGRTWLNAINPIADAVLSPDGVLTFVNAAVAAGTATAPVHYAVSWARFDNETGRVDPQGDEMTWTEPRGPAPASLLANAAFVRAVVRTDHPDHPAWRQPVELYFRRTGAGWQTVGLIRQP
jgi:hypothetical protein